MTDAPDPAADPETNSQTEDADRVLNGELKELEGHDVPLTDHAPARQPTGPEQRGTGGSG